jgi:protein tyrosine/serine phosphatase
MATRWQVVLGVAAAGVVAATPLLYSSHRHTHMRNIRVVEEGVLYRSAQLSPEGLERLVHEKGIRTVISLRASRVKGGPDPDAWEEEFCAARGLKHVRIPPRVWGADETGEVPAEEAIEAFLAVMDDPKNHPALVHCYAGIHRTGSMCAIFRMEYQHWPNEQAIEEMRRCGFEPLTREQDIAEYLHAYVPRWKRKGK